MKQHLLRIFFFVALLIVSGKMNAQYVNIANQDLANWFYNNGYSSVMSGNSLNVGSSLVQNATYLSINVSPFQSQNIDITIVNNFPNLNTLQVLGSFGQAKSIGFIGNLSASIKSLTFGNLTIANYPILPPNIQFLNFDRFHCPYANCKASLIFPQSLRSIIINYCNFDSLPSLPDSLVYFHCNGNGLNVLPVLPNTLKYLIGDYNPGLSLPMSLPDSLTFLSWSNNFAFSLPVTLPNKLTYLDVSDNKLDSLPPLPSGLKELYCDVNKINSLPTIPDSLIKLNLSFNKIDSLPNLSINLESLKCSYNLIDTIPNLPQTLTELEVNNQHISIMPQLPPNLKFFNCSYCSLDSIPILPNNLSSLNCEGNNLDSLPNLPIKLKSLNCSRNNFSVFPALNDSMYKIDMTKNSFVIFKPLPPFIYNLYLDSCNLYCLPKLNKINSFSWKGNYINCLPSYGKVNYSAPLLDTFPLCDLFNTNNCEAFWNISGNVFNDTNTNCISNSNEPKYSNIKLNLYQNGSLLQSTYSNQIGNYSFDTDTGFYSVAIDTIGVPISVSCPSTFYDTTYIANNDTLRYDKNFALTCKPGFDVGVSAIVRDSGIFRPANFTNVKILAGDLSNHYGLHCAVGTSGAVQIIITGPATYISTVNGALTPLLNGDTLTYTISDFGLVDFDNDFQIQVQTDTLAQANQQVCFDVSVTPTLGDNNSTNNTLMHCFTVVNSYDPNDKAVYPAERIDDADGKLTYTIRFQNTGNAPAQHIYIMDTLDAALDASTFELLAYSVQPQVQLVGHVLRFNFPNINLPDSTNDEPNSHGYVQFSIKLKDSLPLGTTVNNTSFIYFDFNAPVQTNTVTDTLTDCDNLIANVWFPKTSLCKNDTLFAGMELQYPYSNIKWLVDNVLAATGDSAAISNIGLGTHTVKVVIKTPYCLSKTFYTITVNDLPQPTLGNDSTVCGSLLIDAGAGFTNYLWSNGASTQSILATNSATYTVTVTDSNSCKASDVIVAIVNANPAINLGVDTSTCNLPIVLNAFGANLSYLWNTGGLTASIVADTSGFYFVTVTDTNGCVASDSILFIKNPLPSIPVITLNGFTFTSSSSAGNQWLLNGNLIANATNQTYNAAQPGWYSVLITDTNGCYSLSDSLFVTNTNFNEYALQIGVEVLVNGTAHAITITGLKHNSVQSIKLFNTLGSLLYANENLSTLSQIDISTDNFSKGVYFIQLESKNRNEVVKIFLH